MLEEGWVNFELVVVDHSVFVKVEEMELMT